MPIDIQNIESIKQQKEPTLMKNRINESTRELSSDTKLTSQELDHLCSVMIRAKVLF